MGNGGNPDNVAGASAGDDPPKYVCTSHRAFFSSVSTSRALSLSARSRAPLSLFFAPRPRRPVAPSLAVAPPPPLARRPAIAAPGRPAIAAPARSRARRANPRPRSHPPRRPAVAVVVAVAVAVVARVIPTVAALSQPSRRYPDRRARYPDRRARPRRPDVPTRATARRSFSSRAHARGARGARASADRRRGATRRRRDDEWLASRDDRDRAFRLAREIARSRDREIARFDWRARSRDRGGAVYTVCAHSEALESRAGEERRASFGRASTSEGRWRGAARRRRRVGFGGYSGDDAGARRRRWARD